MATLIWDGVDSYIDVDSPIARSGDYNIVHEDDGTYTLYTRREKFKSFEAEEIDESLIPTDEDGEMILDGLYSVQYPDGYKVFRAVEEPSEEPSMKRASREQAKHVTFSRGPKP